MSDSERERAAIVKWLEGKIESVRRQIQPCVQTGDYMQAAILDLAVEALQSAIIGIENSQHLQEATNGRKNWHEQHGWDEHG